MSYINKFNPVRTKITTTVAAYLAPKGLLFYDADTKTLRVGDGVTLGGVVITQDSHLARSLDFGPIVA